MHLGADWRTLFPILNLKLWDSKTFWSFDNFFKKHLTSFIYYWVVWSISLIFVFHDWLTFSEKLVSLSYFHFITFISPQNRWYMLLSTQTQWNPPIHSFIDINHQHSPQFLTKIDHTHPQKKNPQPPETISLNDQLTHPA